MNRRSKSGHADCPHSSLSFFSNAVRSECMYSARRSTSARLCRDRIAGKPNHEFSDSSFVYISAACARAGHTVRHSGTQANPAHSDLGHEAESLALRVVSEGDTVTQLPCERQELRPPQRQTRHKHHTHTHMHKVQDHNNTGLRTPLLVSVDWLACQIVNQSGLAT